jgi:threonine synthase
MNRVVICCSVFDSLKGFGMISPYFAHVCCLECDHEIPASSYHLAACPNCGSAWLDARYDYAEVAQIWRQGLHRRVGSLWRYKELLPIQETYPEISMGEGWTPLQRLIQYERSYGHQGLLYVKDERAQPTNSFKDRQAVIASMAMKQQGITECVLASTGNAAVAYAAYCARAGIKLWLFLTSLVPAEKMREAALYGCEVVKVGGTYDETKHVAAEFAKHKGIHLDKGAKAVPGKESMKTLAFEIAEQLGLKAHPDDMSKWAAPDWYIQGVSGGIGPLGVWKGFSELYEMGFIDKLPKLGIVQAAGCAPMVNAFHANLDDAPAVVPQTLIHVLATGEPGYAYKLLRQACLSNGGTMVAVEDGEAFTAMRNIASKGGLSVEPATAVAFAGLEKMLTEGIIGKEETVVINCSGHTFPAESHILGDQYERYILELQSNDAAHLAFDGLGAALQNLDEQVTTIVVVDDNPQDRRLIRRLLKSYKQYRVYEARDGKHALEVIQDRKPDLVVTDLTMPEMDGFELLRAIKNNPETADIPVIVASAKHISPHDRQTLEKYAQAVWTKGGLDSRKLVESVVNTLGHEPLSVIQQQSSKPSVLPEHVETLDEFAPTIVVIDDNPLDVRLARRVIQSGERNYNLIEANTGRDGLKAIYNYHPELIILDLTLPDMDGIDIIEHVQKDADLQDIPIIIYSAREMRPEETERMQSQIASLQKSTLNRQAFLDAIEDELK